MLNTKTLLKTITSLDELKLTSEQTKDLYPTAQQIPSFLLNSLLNKKRTIKKFVSEDALIQAFYFQLMKLAFQLEVQEKDYAAIVQSILVGQAQFTKGQMEDQYFSDQQYRKYLFQFFQTVKDQPFPNFQKTISHFPIIDQMLLNIFRKIVPITLFLQNEDLLTKNILTYLCDKFSITMEIVQGLYKFIESDTFLYIENSKTVYAIFVDHHLSPINSNQQSNYSSESEVSSEVSVKSLKDVAFQRRGSKPIWLKDTFQLAKNQEMLSQLDEGKKESSAVLPIFGISKIEFQNHKKLDVILEEINEKDNFPTIHNLLQSKTQNLKLPAQQKRTSITSKYTSKLNLVKPLQSTADLSKLIYPTRIQQQKEIEKENINQTPSQSPLQSSSSSFQTSSQNSSSSSLQVYQKQGCSNIPILSNVQRISSKLEKQQVESISSQASIDLFTNSFILEQLNNKYTSKIRIIKEDYRSFKKNSQSQGPAFYY